MYGYRCEIILLAVWTLTVVSAVLSLHLMFLPSPSPKVPFFQTGAFQRENAMLCSLTPALSLHSACALWRHRTESADVAGSVPEAGELLLCLAGSGWGCQANSGGWETGRQGLLPLSSREALFYMLGFHQGYYL